MNTLFMLKIGNSAFEPTLKLKLTKLKSAIYSLKEQEKYDHEKEFHIYLLI